MGHPLLRTAAIGGAGYYAGKKISEGRQAEAMQNQAIADLQDQVTAQETASYSPPPPQQPAQTTVPANTGSDTVSRLQELANLHATGVLTDEEFAAAKQKVLSGG